MNRRPLLILFILLPILKSSSQSSSKTLGRHYKEGELLSYQMKASNQGRDQTIRYEADAKGIVKKDSSGHFIEEFQWSNLSFNGQAVPSPAKGWDFPEQVSLDPAVSPSVPDFRHVPPILLGPSADLFTFYADVWLAIKQATLVHAGDHAYVKQGTPSSWADGVKTLLGEDSIDFDITLSEVNSNDGTARLLIRHVPPARPEIKIPAKWMEAPVADTPNNWVEVTKMDSGKYLGEVGKETFDVDVTLSLADGKILSATMDNPVTVYARECTDEALAQCSAPEHYQIRRQIELTLEKTGAVVDILGPVPAAQSA